MTALEVLYYCCPRLVYAVRVCCGDNYEQEMELLPALCRGDRMSLDVGAKTGMYTRRMTEHSGATVAFEPIPVLAHLLRRVFSRRARIEEVALSDRAGSAELRMPFSREGKPRYGRSTIEPENRLADRQLSSVREVVVGTRRLDTYGFSDVGFVKIDVEGHELSVLGGARETLMRERPNVLIEVQEEHRPGSVERVRKWFAERGYDGFFLRKRRLAPIDDFDVEVDQERDGIENFIFVPDGRCGAVEGELRRLVSSRLGA